jgi:hypothetical protein
MYESEESKETIQAPVMKESEQRSLVLVKLMKGPIYRVKSREIWEMLERYESSIRNHFDQIGVALLLDNAEGFAFLKQKNLEREEINMPQLISRRQLTMHQSLLLLMLRKKLSEHDTDNTDPRLIVTREEIYDWLIPFYPETNNEINQLKKFSALITKVVDLGFMARLGLSKDEFEVQRIISSFINVEFMTDALEKLQAMKISSEDEQNVE